MLFHFQYTVETIQNGHFYAGTITKNCTRGVTSVQISFFSSPGEELLVSSSEVLWAQTFTNLAGKELLLQ